MDLDFHNQNEVGFINYSFTEQQGPDDYFHIFLKGDEQEREFLLPKILQLEKILNFYQAGMNPTYLVAEKKNDVLIQPVSVDLSVPSKSSELSGIYLPSGNMPEGCYSVSRPDHFKLITKIDGERAVYEIKYHFQQNQQPISKEDLKRSCLIETISQS